MSDEIKHNLKLDEVCLWNLFGPDKPFTWPRGAAEYLGIPPKRLRYILGKWSDKGIYEWGTVQSLGWKETYYDVQVGYPNIPLLNTNLFISGGPNPVRKT